MFSCPRKRKRTSIPFFNPQKRGGSEAEARRSDSLFKTSRGSNLSFRGSVRGKGFDISLRPQLGLEHCSFGFLCIVCHSLRGMCLRSSSFTRGGQTWEYKQLVAAPTFEAIFPWHAQEKVVDANRGKGLVHERAGRCWPSGSKILDCKDPTWATSVDKFVTALKYLQRGQAVSNAVRFVDCSVECERSPLGVWAGTLASKGDFAASQWRVIVEELNVVIPICFHCKTHSYGSQELPERCLWSSSGPPLCSAQNSSNICRVRNS